MGYFVANWKMHTPPLPAWVKAVSQARLGREVQVVLCPPFTQLAAAQMVLSGTEIALGAQNCHYRPEGAFTGEIAAPMLARAGCSYVIVGHSERREHAAETNEAIKAKADAAIDAGLVPIICVGESRAQREASQHEAVVTEQLSACLPQRSAPMLIAYEPVWAIGTGLSAQNDDISAMHAHIKKTLGKQAPVLYGGSVKPANVAAIMALSGVDGVLVGSASLEGEAFAEMIKAGA